MLVMESTMQKLTASPEEICQAFSNMDFKTATTNILPNIAGLTNNRVKQCNGCLRFGHVVSQCRGGMNALVCSICASTDHQSNGCTSQSVKCINCIRAKLEVKSHTATDRTCPIYINNCGIKIVMAKLALSYREASDFFESHIRGILTDTFENEEGEPDYRTFEEAVHTALKKAGASSGRHSFNSRRPPVAWWNQECNELIEKKRNSYQAFKKAPNIDNINAYYATCKLVKNRLRKIKKESFHSFCSSLNLNSNASNT